MSSQPSKDITPQEEPNSSPEDAKQMMEALKKLADQWRERLDIPATQSLIKAGKIKIDPLILELLDLFPPKST